MTFSISATSSAHELLSRIARIMILTRRPYLVRDYQSSQVLLGSVLNIRLICNTLKQINRNSGHKHIFIESIHCQRALVCTLRTL